MLEITREHTFGRDHTLVLDGQDVGRWRHRDWKSGGRVELPGQVLQLHARSRARSYELRVRDRVVARAERAGMRRWTLTHDGTEYELSRASGLRGERHLLRDGERVGVLRRAGFGKRVVVDLPGAPASLQVFAGLVALSLWQRESAAAAASASSGG